MLYVNVYLVGQSYGGPEEGGWWYDVGEPKGSIPINTVSAKGQSYYIADGKVHSRQCDSCHGAGEVETEDETYPERGTFMAHCNDCGELPADFEATAKLMAEMEEMFKDEMHSRHHEHIRVSLEDHFAAPYPDRKPRYE